MDRLGEPRESLGEWRAGLPAEQSFEACVTIGCSLSTFDSTESFLQHDFVYGAFGIHPLSAKDWTPEVESRVEALVKENPKVVAIGECGLDYHYENDADSRALQATVFEQHIHLSNRLSKPLIVHTREAEEDTLRLMREHLRPAGLVHVHCFTSSVRLAQQLLASFPNLYIGFTGVITFKNASAVRDVVKAVPLNRILLETDGPYMAPVPHRGKAAHPGHVPYIAQQVAEVKGVPLEEVLHTVRDNTRTVYGI